MNCPFCQDTRLAPADIEPCAECNSTGELTLAALLATFPKRLKRAAEAAIANEIGIRDLQADIDRLGIEIELEIAQDGTLKNEQQRKARRYELMQADSYQAALCILQQAQDNQQRLKIERQHLIDQFTVAKLMAQEHIASLSNR